MDRDWVAEGVIIGGVEPRDYRDETLPVLDSRGIDMGILTGDHEDATRFQRENDVVEHVFSGVSPEAKAETIHRIATGQRVAMSVTVRTTQWLSPGQTCGSHPVVVTQ